MCASSKIGIRFSQSTLPFAEDSMSAWRVRWFSPQRMFIHCSHILCLPISSRAGKWAIPAPIGAGCAASCMWSSENFPFPRTPSNKPAHSSEQPLATAGGLNVFPYGHAPNRANPCSATSAASTAASDRGSSTEYISILMAHRSNTRFPILNIGRSPTREAGPYSGNLPPFSLAQ